jgi:hypothetical protein
MTKHPTPHSLTFLHPVYSPKGGIEGAIVRIAGERAQVTIKHAPDLERAFADLREGDQIEAQITPLPAHDKGEAGHPVYELTALKSNAGSAGTNGSADSVGHVARLNYALHGEPNGVVLDNGDFIHLRPDGQRQLGLKVGDAVEAFGDAKALRFGNGRVIEASRVNGQELAKPKPKKPAGHKPPPKGPAHHTGQSH